MNRKISTEEVQSQFEELCRYSKGADGVTRVCGVSFDLWRDLQGDSLGEGSNPSEGSPPDDFRHLVSLAHRGDLSAIAKVASNLSALCRELEMIWKKYPAVVREAAKTLTDWPVTFTLNPKDQRRVKAYVADLSLGDDAAFSTDSTHKVDRESRWTSYAENAVRTFRLNMRFIPLIQSWAEKERRKFILKGLTDAAGNRREVQVSDEAEPIIILETWMLDCVEGKEREPKAIWKAMKPAIKIYWKNNPSEYEWALSNFERYKDPSYGNALTEGQKREHALDRIKQAIASLLSRG